MIMCLHCTPKRFRTQSEPSSPSPDVVLGSRVSMRASNGSRRSRSRLVLCNQELIYFLLVLSYHFWYTYDMAEEKEIKVVFYKTPSGNEPVRTWLKSLPSYEKKKNRRRYQGCRDGVANRITSRQKDGFRLVGSPYTSAQQDIPGFLYCLERVHGITPWNHKEKSEDTA